jgi:hypothetical protein
MLRRSISVEPYYLSSFKQRNVIHPVRDEIGNASTFFSNNVSLTGYSGSRNGDVIGDGEKAIG